MKRRSGGGGRALREQGSETIMHREHVEQRGTTIAQRTIRFSSRRPRSQGLPRPSSRRNPLKCVGASIFTIVRLLNIDLLSASPPLAAGRSVRSRGSGEGSESRPRRPGQAGETDRRETVTHLVERAGRRYCAASTQDPISEVQDAA